MLAPFCGKGNRGRLSEKRFTQRRGGAEDAEWEGFKRFSEKRFTQSRGGSKDAEGEEKRKAKILIFASFAALRLGVRSSGKSSLFFQNTKAPDHLRTYIRV